MIKPELLDTIEIEAGKEDASTFLQKSASNASSKVWLTGIQTGVSQNLFQEASLSAFQSLVDLDLPTLQPNEYMKPCGPDRRRSIIPWISRVAAATSRPPQVATKQDPRPRRTARV